MVDLKKIRIENIVPERSPPEVLIDVLRLDLVHPIVSGNKWFKLRYYLEEAKQKGISSIITYGGAWSNHILATAYACKQEGIHCTLMIRGEMSSTTSRTIQKAQEMGAEVRYLPRTAYRENKNASLDVGKDILIIPEGGSGENGVRGASTISEHYNGKGYTHIVCAAGTGTMAAGILRRLEAEQELVVFSVLKGFKDLEKNIREQAGFTPGRVRVIHDFHFEGYARSAPGLMAFMNEFFSRTGIPTDFVYTGKLFFGLDRFYKEGHFPPGSRILAIHSGGLQGNDSLPKGTLIF